MFRKPIFWIAFVVIAVACVAYSAVTLPRVFPLVSLDLRMDWDAALESARRLADTHGWGPEGYRQAASFELEDQVRDFVELEAGGRDAFIDMIDGDIYSPYTWRVRHFKPGEANETEIRFTPAGEPYGFREQLPEDEPGASLEPDEAQPIAEAGAVETWGIALDDYELVERQQDVRPSGRTDHTFVYERPDVQAGEGRYRLQLVVGGDRLTELTHLLKVPEGFDRRFQEMRSANTAAAMTSIVVMAVLFMGGAIVGLFFLLRERWVLWRKPLLWAGIVSFGMAMLTVNQWPLAWMNYDTAVSSTNFLLQRIALLFGQVLGFGALYLLSFMAAESLTRRAFPGQIQFWKSWSTPVASSPALLGRTVAGYLLVAVDLAFLVLFYAFAFEKLGWWSPSEALLNPNVLATPFPWLTSIAISLHAGFWEECFFRAVPLAGAALLGVRFGGKRYWIIGALILQALVFGAGHADYPAQPFYARVVELFLPSVFWGVIYLTFGLLPVIIMHFTFDVVFISLPLWVSSASGLWDDRVLVVGLTLVPLWAVLTARWRRGRWSPVDEESLNRSWRPSPVRTRPAVAAARQAGIGGPRRNLLWALGVAGMVAWIVLLAPPGDAPPLRVGRAEAISAAADALGERGLAPPDSYRPLAEVQSDQVETHRFAWQEGGPDLYRDLLGRYLPAPRWRVRYATFEGDVAARAEEYQVWVDGSGTVTRVRHQLPEAAEGADLPEEEARARARSAVIETYGLDPDALNEVKASPSKEKDRTDWLFEFSDPDALPLEEGETRVGVEIAGDELSDTYRYVHLPEEWERAERNRRTLASVAHITCIILGIAVFVAGGVFGIVRWSRGRFGIRVFVTFALLLVTIRAVILLIGWPAATARFQTAMTFQLQAALFVAFGLLVVLLTSAVVALNAGFLDRWRPAPPPGGGLGAALSGASLGAFVAGIAAAIVAIAPQAAPRWPAYGPAGSAAPWLTATLGPVSGFITMAALLLLVFVALDRWTAGWTRRKGLVSILLLAAGLVVAGMESVQSLPSWLAAGVLVGAGIWAAYFWVLRFDLSLLPVAVGAFIALEVLAEGLGGAYPGALAGSIAAVVLVGIVAFLWYRSLAGNGGARTGEATNVNWR
jgi:membrane protease YdiL (CAAX protease family)